MARWPLRRDQPVDEALACLLLHRRMLRRIDEDDAVLVEQPLVALHDDCQVGLVAERQPGAAIGQQMASAAAAVLSAAPMPRPIDLYQSALSVAMSMPASFHSRSSATWVPTCRRARRRRPSCPGWRATPRRCRWSPLTPAGSPFGPISTKSLYITGIAPDAEALGGTSPPRQRGRTRRRHRPPGDIERLSGAERHHLDLDARCRLEQRQQMAKQARESWVDVVEATRMDVSWAGVGGGLRRRQCGDGQQGERSTDDVHDGAPFGGQTSSSPAMNFALRRSPAHRRNRAQCRFRRRGRDAAARPRRRGGRASPRSCVDNSTLMPRWLTARMTSSIALVEAGSRLAVGSSRNSTSGSRASARARRAAAARRRQRRAGRSAACSEGRPGRANLPTPRRARCSGDARRGAH